MEVVRIGGVKWKLDYFRIMHCSGLTIKILVDTWNCSGACDIAFAILAVLLTQPISKMTLSRNLSRSLAISSIICFLDVREPILTTSNKLLQSVSSWKDMLFLYIVPISADKVDRRSNRSLNAMNSLPNAERTTCLDIYYLNSNRTGLPFLSERKQRWTNLVKRLWLFAKDESAKRIIHRESLLSLRILNIFVVNRVLGSLVKATNKGIDFHI